MAPTPLEGAARKIAVLPRRIVEDAAARFDEVARETASRAVGGALQIHGRRNRRPTVKLKTYTRLEGSGSTARAFVRPSPLGIWVWLESGTAEHEIGARKARRGGGSSRTAKYLKAPGAAHPIRAPITHPGSPGKRVWTRAIATFRAEASDFLVTDLREVIRRG